MYELDWTKNSNDRGWIGMIHYHGLPITPTPVANYAVQAGHAFVSYAHPEQVSTAIEVCQSFAIDNGAFSAWKSGKPTANWGAYYEWALNLKKVPSCDFAVIPDVIDGSESDNDFLLEDCPLPKWFGAPVWHMHESLERLEQLANYYVRVCIGSSGEYTTIGTTEWWSRIGSAMRVICDDMGRPICKLHGLRMLDPAIFTKFPFSSADSTNIARSVGIDSKWRKGNYPPPTKEARAQVMRSRIEAHNAPATWNFMQVEQDNLF
jgi:hypothetical protein